MKTQKKESLANQAIQTKIRWRRLKEKIKGVGLLDSFTIFLVIIFVAVMFSDSVSEWGWVSYLLGSNGEQSVLEWVGDLLGTGDDKEKTLTFIGVGIGGLVLWQRARSAEKQAEATKNAAENQAKAANSQADATKRQAEANKLTEVGHTQERLKTSIEHLGDRDTSVRIGAAYELYHLAEDREKYRKTVCNILCSHIRHKTQEKNYKKDQEDGPSEEIKVFLDLLCGQDNGGLFSQCQIDLSFSFLRRAWLPGAQLQGAKLLETQLQGAWLFDAQLQGALLSGAQLQEADLEGAQLQGAWLFDAQLQGALLLNAQLQEANLEGVWLQGTSLSRTYLQGACLRWAQLHGAGLQDAHLQGADLSEAQLQGANLSGAQLQGAWLLSTQLYGAHLRKSQLQGAHLQYAQLQGANLSGAQLRGVNSSKLLETSFQGRIRSRVGKENDFANVIFSGGLDAHQVEEIIASMPDSLDNKERKGLKNRLNEHVNKEAGNKPPDNSGAITGAYTESDAEKWIAEYEKSTKLSAIKDE